MAKECIAQFVELATRATEQPGEDIVTDQELSDVLTAAVKLYAARAEDTGRHPLPIDPEKASATEIVVTVCEMVRATNINMFDLSMWFGRPRGRGEQ